MDEPRPIFGGSREEPCLCCGEETAIGSVFYSDRREGTAPDGSRYFVCVLCIRRLVAHDRQVDLDDPAFHRLVITAGVLRASQNTWSG